MTGLCATVNKAEDWTPIHLKKCSDLPNQKWILKKTEDEKFQIVSKEFDKCLNIKGIDDAQKGLKANLYTCYENDNMEYEWKE